MTGNLERTDEDDAVMEDRGDDDACETSAVKEKHQPVKPPNQEIALREACGHYPYWGWCRACVRDSAVRCPQTRPCMDKGFFIDGQEQILRSEGQITKGVTPLLMVEVKPSVMIWSMFVQYKDVRDQTAIKETVES